MFLDSPYNTILLDITMPHFIGIFVATHKHLWSDPPQHNLSYHNTPHHRDREIDITASYTHLARPDLPRRLRRLDPRLDPR